MKFEVPFAMCPHCKEELEYADFFFQECDGRDVWFSSKGYCNKCGKTYRWEDKFKFAGSFSIECVEE